MRAILTYFNAINDKNKVLLFTCYYDTLGIESAFAAQAEASFC